MIQLDAVWLAKSFYGWRYVWCVLLRDVKAGEFENESVAGVKSIKRSMQLPHNSQSARASSSSLENGND